MDPEARKTTLRALETGIYLVGCTDGSTQNVFMGSWLTQCSFEPPMVTLGLKRDTQHHAFIKEQRKFVVNLLDKDQTDLAKKFFKHQNDEDGKIAGEAFRAAAKTGAPVLESAAAWFEVQVEDWVEGGDHDVVVGKVVDAGVNRGGFTPMTETSTGWNYGG